jgi:hypothetical protein
MSQEMRHLIGEYQYLRNEKRQNIRQYSESRTLLASHVPNCAHLQLADQVIVTAQHIIDQDKRISEVNGRLKSMTELAEESAFKVGCLQKECEVLYRDLNKTRIDNAIAQVTLLILYVLTLVAQHAR